MDGGAVGSLEPKELKAIKDLTASVSALVDVLERRERRDAVKPVRGRAQGSQKARDGPLSDSFLKQGIDGMD